jgi:hypothetical protein
MLRRILTVSALLGAGAIFAASRESGEVAAAMPVASVGGATPPIAGSSNPVTQEAPSNRKGRTPESTVYVDGVPVAVLRATELPPGFKTRLTATHWGNEERYLVTDYLAALHVDVAKVKAVHFHGGSRVVLVDGDDLRKNGKDLSFTFTMGDRGKVNMEFPGALHIDTTIDLLSNMTIYVEKAPPSKHRGGAGDYLAFADGKPIEGIPYADGEQLKGTRVYVDGKRIAVLKRKLLPNTVLAGEVGASSTFSLIKYLDLIHAPADIKAIDFMSDDDLVERLDVRHWTEQKSGLTFSLPTHSRGQAVMNLARLDTAKARISSIQLYVGSEPPKRWLAPPDVVAVPSETEAQAANQNNQDNAL